MSYAVKLGATWLNPGLTIEIGTATISSYFFSIIALPKAAGYP
jgi:hypothetical protein